VLAFLDAPDDVRIPHAAFARLADETCDRPVRTTKIVRRNRL
jgi:hypothetical protein